MLEGNNKTKKDILPFVTQYRSYTSSVSNLKEALLKKWHLINPYFTKFLKNHLSFCTEKENP